MTSDGAALEFSVGLQILQGRYPASRASLKVLKNSTFSYFGFFARQVAIQNTEVVLTPA
nr:hypothetical protein [Gilliamella apicola]